MNLIFYQRGSESSLHNLPFLELGWLFYGERTESFELQLSFDTSFSPMLNPEFSQCELDGEALFIQVIGLNEITYDFFDGFRNHPH